jgi:hypothetical protein
MDEFMDELWGDLEAGKVDIPIGAARGQFDLIERPRLEEQRKALAK